jgi:hypothetical protein
MNSEDAMKKFDQDAQKAEAAAKQIVTTFNDSRELRAKASQTIDTLIGLLRAHAPTGTVAEMREELATQLTACQLFQKDALIKLAEAFAADADLLLCYKDICDNVFEERLYEYEVEMRRIDELVKEASSSPGTALIGSFDVMLMEYIFLELSNRDEKIAQTFEQAIQTAVAQTHKAACRRMDRSKMNAAQEKQRQLLQLIHEGNRDEEAKQLLAEVKKLSFPCEMHAKRMAKHLANAAIAVMVAQLNIDEAAQDPNTSGDTIAQMRDKLAEKVETVHASCVSTSQVITLNEIIAYMPDELEWLVKSV